MQIPNPNNIWAKKWHKDKYVLLECKTMQI